MKHSWKNLAVTKVSSKSIAAAVLVALFVHTSALATPAKTVSTSTKSASAAHTQKLEGRIMQLASEVDTASQKGSGTKFEEQLGNQASTGLDNIFDDFTSPDELAAIALWAYHSPKYWKDRVITCAFFYAVGALGEIKGDGASNALLRIKSTLVKDGRWDAHLSESVEDAMDNQRKLR